MLEQELYRAWNNMWLYSRDAQAVLSLDYINCYHASQDKQINAVRNSAR
ncbi:Uncharacterised protein [Serratia liquefaciens]|nr:Uncharacterised protein [Serratia liquefaciens]